MKLCIVNRNTGWPVHDPRHPHGAVVEVDDSEAAAGIASGYLIPADPLSPEFLPVHAEILRAHRDAKAKEPQPPADPPVVEMSPNQEAESARAAEAAANTEAARKRQVSKILGLAPSTEPKQKTVGPVVPHTADAGKKE